MKSLDESKAKLPASEEARLAVLRAVRRLEGIAMSLQRTLAAGNFEAAERHKARQLRARARLERLLYQYADTHGNRPPF